MPQGMSRFIGESWEFSCDPDFPSRIHGSTQTLIDLFQEYPMETLGSTGEDHTCKILVKLLNAASPLSLQVHPADDDSDLQENECGKPESWLIIKAEPGAGLYLGFSEGISKDELRKRLQSGEDCRDLLKFVEVKPGDYFEIEPGTPHAIGGGVTLLEPQRSLTGQSGKTYRLWDWGRRYYQDGRLAEEGDGSPRELHLDEGLKLVNPNTQVGDAFVDSTRRSPISHSLANGIDVCEYPPNCDYQVCKIKMPPKSDLRLTISEGYGVFIPLQGPFEFVGEEKTIECLAGQPAFIPAVVDCTKIECSEGGEFVLVIPSWSKAIWEAL